MPGDDAEGSRAEVIGEHGEAAGDKRQTSWHPGYEDVP